MVTRKIDPPIPLSGDTTQRRDNAIGHRIGEDLDESALSRGESPTAEEGGGGTGGTAATGHDTGQAGEPGEAQKKI